MNRALQAFCFAGASLSLVMCNVEDPSDATQFLVEESAQAAPASPEPAPCLPVSTQVTSGQNDNFAAGPVESPAPRAAVVTWINSVYSIAGVRNYDDAQTNQYFAHSFVFAPPTSQHYLTGGAVLGRLQCLDFNDGFFLGFVDAVTGLVPAPYWGGRINQAPIGGICAANPAALAFNYNLASLPGTGQNLIPTMASNGFLDVVMQDDSRMDFLTLRLSWSCKAPPLP